MAGAFHYYSVGTFDAYVNMNALGSNPYAPNFSWFNASSYSTVYQEGANVHPNSIKTLMYIKF